MTENAENHQLFAVGSIYAKAHSTHYTISHIYVSSMVQWLGSVAFTDMAGVRFPVGELGISISPVLFTG
ncbi:hypothetical protein G6F57_023433 [Rhizopus arrhizus]|nr:hypothetical protein G6F23_014842 [Rhizopus arrhizus]KAG0921373.1 hypothetical protein G6F32_015132 [Rhizopus arrhizus]KAG0922295.1 hypothetical protein G6F30_014096 [Rhizopus arrhizus]KAG0971709.1 hypothetical protein G6F28_014223 [Rhizopus arrhizus]KAG0995158.1 hypothetical protein G6F27_014039 [Rhizopus arrhizus]